MTAKHKIFILAIVLAALLIWIAWGNKALKLNSYTVTSSRLPRNFDGYRIAHISDLHNAQMGKKEAGRSRAS